MGGRIPIRPAAVAGMLAAAAFPMVVVALDIAQRGFLVRADPRLDPLVSNPISAHELGPFGLAQYLNFLLTGLLIVFFAIGLYQALPPGRLAKATRIVLVVMGFGFSLGVFTLDVGNPHSWHGYLHVAGFFILTLASLVMPFLVAAVFLRGGQVSWLGWLAFAAGIATVIVLFVPQVRGTFPNWFGPASKLHLMITFGFLETVAIWVWISGRRVADEGPKRPGRPST